MPVGVVCCVEVNKCMGKIDQCALCDASKPVGSVSVGGPCHVNARCEDTGVDNVTCHCRPGFTGDGFNCTGFDQSLLQRSV